ncbi:MAG: multi-sensor hybrid histidine kinase [Segetibacter sp.]|jgi:CheY-like chemotaxis protein|nr:multi-sensor hybrid histidine kinase [Segetibacter sp.]
MSENILLNKSVLVAEDNAINQMVVKHTLLKLGASADIAGDGAEAIEKCKKNKYDLILMDIQMPLMDGYEATTYIRNQLQSNVPIIAMTAFGLNGEDEKCYECGMNDYVSKPFTIENLSTVIQKVLSVPSEVTHNPHILVSRNISVDLSMLYDISGEDEAYICVMVQTFLENMPNTLKKIDQCLSDENWDGLFQAAHYAKSTLSVIKVSEMFDAVLAIELSAKNKINLQTLPALVQKLNDGFVIAEELLSKKFIVACN